MKAPVLIPLLLCLVLLHVVSVSALPQWRPQGRFGKRLDPVFRLLARLQATEDGDLDAETEEGQHDEENGIKTLSPGLCLRLQNGHVRCLGQRKRRAVEAAEVVMEPDFSALR